METVIIGQKKKVAVVEEEKQYANLEEFLKGTISGEELVKYVCDKLDEKYSAFN